MREHELVLKDDVVSIYTDGVLTSQFGRDKVLDIQNFIRDAGFTEDAVSQKIDDIFLRGRTGFLSC